MNFVTLSGWVSGSAYDQLAGAAVRERCHAIGIRRRRLRGGYAPMSMPHADHLRTIARRLADVMMHSCRVRTADRFLRAGENGPQ